MVLVFRSSFWVRKTTRDVGILGASLVLSPSTRLSLGLRGRHPRQGTGTVSPVRSCTYTQFQEGTTTLPTSSITLSTISFHKNVNGDPIVKGQHGNLRDFLGFLVKVFSISKWDVRSTGNDTSTPKQTKKKNFRTSNINLCIGNPLLLLLNPRSFSEPKEEREVEGPQIFVKESLSDI